MKPTREELLNAGFELEEGFENCYIKKLTDRINIELWDGGLNSFNCFIGQNPIYDEHFQLTKENLNKIHERFTGEPLNFEKKEEWKIGNVLKYVCSDNTYYTGTVCKVRENGRIDFVGLDADYNDIDCGDLYTNYDCDAFTKIAETPEEYYRQKFESEKSNEPKEEVKEVEPKIGEVWEVTMGDRKEIIFLVNIDEDSIPYLVFKVNRVGSSYDGNWCSKRYITFNKKLADSYKEYKQQ